MAQSATTASVGRVNRRFLFLALVLAALSAVLIYPLLTRSSDSATTADTVPVVVASVTINPGTEITSDMLEVRQVSDTALGAQAYADVELVVGEVARYPIVPGEQLLASKIVGRGVTASPNVLSNFIETGKRGLAITTDQVIGAGGLVLPGDYVDIFWIPNDSPEDVPGAQLLAEDVEVLAVQQTIVDIPPTAPGLLEEGEEPPVGSEARVRGTEENPLPEAVTVTLLLTVEEVQRVFCGDEAGEIRLAIRAFGDHSSAGVAPVECIVLGQDQG